jgi:hypothetical protein
MAREMSFALPAGPVPTPQRTGTVYSDFARATQLKADITHPLCCIATNQYPQPARTISAVAPFI